MTTTEYLKTQIAESIYDKNYYQQKINEMNRNGIKTVIDQMNLKSYVTLRNEAAEGIEHFKKAMIAVKAHEYQEV